MDQDTVAETKSSRVFSRRDFLKLAGGVGSRGLFSYLGLDSFMAHSGTRGSTLTGDFWNKLETFTLGMSEQDTKKLEKKVEEEFYINVVNPVEQRSVNAISYESGSGGQEVEVPVVEWSASELVVLATSLMSLPPKMYIPGRNYPNMPGEDRVKFIMLGEAPNVNPAKGGTTAAFCRCGNEGGAVVLGRVDFPQIGIGRIWTRSAICHELAHKVVNADQLDLPGLGKKLGINDETQLNKVFSTASSTGWPADLRYGSTNYREFVAVGAEAYLFGKERMCGIYSSFLGQEGALKFYLWLKWNVFDKIEYQQGKMVK